MWDKILWFWKYYRSYSYVLAVLLLLTPIQVALQVSIPRMIEFTVDFVKTSKIPDNAVAVWLHDLGSGFGFPPAATYSLSLVLLGLLAASLYAFVQSHRAWMNIKLEWLFRQDAFTNATHRGPDFFNRFRTGDLVTRMTDDVAEKLSWFACSGIFRLYEASLMVIFTVAMMIMIDPLLTLWSAGPLPLLILIFFKSSSILHRRYDHLQSRISAFNDVMESCFTGIRVVKAYVKEQAQKTKFGQALIDRRNAEVSTIRSITIVDSLYMYIWQIGVVIVLMAGGYMVINSDLSLGRLVAFIYYVVYLVFPMFDIGSFLVHSRRAVVSINRLTELEDVPPMVKDVGFRSGDGDLKGSLSFENVELKFDDSDRKIIDNVSLEIAAGQTVAFVGKIGSGKTWLVNMIPRLVDPTAGSIKLDGHDIREFKIAALRGNIGYVPQEPVLYSDTIRNNILLGRNNISDTVIDWAVDVSQLADEVAQLPDGLDTAIGTRGMMISGGQKQRLALARALVGKPKILILDDCTSALDSSTETALWNRLHEVMPEMTAILITHRPDSLERADMVYVLENGKIVESGTHYQLVTSGNRYAKIYRRLQLEEEVTYG